MVTALLHLFFTTSFSWMLVEGLLLWSKVVSVNISEDRRMKLYYIIGWGKLSSLFRSLLSCRMINDLIASSFGIKLHKPCLAHNQDPAHNGPAS